MHKTLVDTLRLVSCCIFDLMLVIMGFKYILHSKKDFIFFEKNDMSLESITKVMNKSAKTVILNKCCKLPKLFQNFCHGGCLFKEKQFKTFKCQQISENSQCIAPPCNPLTNKPCECLFPPNSYDHKFQMS